MAASRPAHTGGGGLRAVAPDTHGVAGAADVLALPPHSIGAAGIVFASNQRLSERLHGMPESTLRRHLAQLLRAGIVSRHDSPNRKRFSHSRGGEITAAFGFDLSPMVHQADAISLAATEAQVRQEELLALRDEVLMLRATLMQETGHEEQLAEVAKLLRRKADKTELREMAAALKNLLKTGLEKASKTEEVSTTYAQNERHIQDSDIIHFDSEGHGRVLPKGHNQSKTTKLRKTKAFLSVKFLAHAGNTSSSSQNPCATGLM